MNRLLEESRTVRVDVGMPMCNQLRLQPTLHQILDEAKPVNLSWPDFFAKAALFIVMTDVNIRMDLHAAKRLLVRLLGDGDDGTTGQTPVTHRPVHRNGGLDHVR